MKHFRLLTLLIAAVLAIGTSFAGPQKAAKGGLMKKAACPICKMQLSTKKDKDHPVAVRLKKGGSVMYCCAACKMPASMLVKKPVKKPVKGRVAN